MRAVNFKDRRRFLRGSLATGATAALGTTLLGTNKLLADDGPRSLTRGDAAILRFLAAAELIETDLWQQYNELGGVNGGNPSYMAALSNLDEDMPQYISDNTDDEMSHVAFLNAYLESKGEEPVNFDRFRTLPSSKATGAKQIGRLTNLMKLNVDTSWYRRYRSEENPDDGANIGQALQIHGEPAIPLNDSDTPPNNPAPVPPASNSDRRMQAIANTAGFHFASIEQGGSSLYSTMALKATNLEVLRIVVSIGGSEVNHFAVWHDKAGNAVAQPLAGVTDPETGVHFPDFNSAPFGGPLFQTNLIFPEPCDFIGNERLPPCSIIRPTRDALAGAVATINFFTKELLFLGQSDAFFRKVMQLAAAADAAQREIDRDR